MDIKSPKRKREDDLDDVPLQVTDYFRRRNSNASESENGSNSPRMIVAGKLQKLDLRGSIDKGSTMTELPDSLLNDTGGFQVMTESSQQAANPPINRIKSPPIRKDRLGKKITATQSKPKSDLWWSDSEISGYSPQDPDEDDYGINGVGYQKTATVAESLRQKRRRQIEEYRRRESGEARAARRNWRARSEGIRGRTGKGGCRSTMSGNLRRGRRGESLDEDDLKQNTDWIERLKEGRSVHFDIG